MGRHRKTYTKEFKESAVTLYHSSGKSTTELAEELGIHPGNICRWLMESRESKEKGIRVFPGQGNPRDEELHLLRKEVADLRETNEILKKATAFFATQKTR
jgi:transposase